MNVFDAGSLPDLASEVVTIGAIGLESFVVFKCVEKLGELKVRLLWPIVLRIEAVHRDRDRNRSFYKRRPEVSKITSPMLPKIFPSLRTLCPNPRLRFPQENYDESVSSSTLASSLESKIRLEITEREASLASRAAQKAEARALRLKKVEENIERTREEEERIKRNQEEALRIAKQKADALKEKEGNELKL